ncbi:MAG: DUF1059 domain-containing protein [Anaerolineae bacterium]
MGVDCDWEGRAETEEELFQLVAEHGATVPGLALFGISTYSWASRLTR